MVKIQPVVAGKIQILVLGKIFYGCHLPFGSSFNKHIFFCSKYNIYYKNQAKFYISLSISVCSVGHSILMKLDNKENIKMYHCMKLLEYDKGHLGKWKFLFITIMFLNGCVWQFFEVLISKVITREIVIMQHIRCNYFTLKI